MRKMNSLIALLAGLAAIPAFADGGQFTAKLCGANNQDSQGNKGVSQVFQGTWTGSDGTSDDAFLIRYFSGKKEIYLASHKQWDGTLGVLFYDVYDTNPKVTPVFLSFGVDRDGNIVGQTNNGDEFAAALHPTQSSDTCDDLNL